MGTSTCYSPGPQAGETPPAPEGLLLLKPGLGSHPRPGPGLASAKSLSSPGLASPGFRSQGERPFSYGNSSDLLTFGEEIHRQVTGHRKGGNPH